MSRRCVVAARLRCRHRKGREGCSLHRRFTRAPPNHPRCREIDSIGRALDASSLEAQQRADAADPEQRKYAFEEVKGYLALLLEKRTVPTEDASQPNVLLVLTHLLQVRPRCSPCATAPAVSCPALQPCNFLPCSYLPCSAWRLFGSWLRCPRRVPCLYFQRLQKQPPAAQLIDLQMQGASHHATCCIRYLRICNVAAIYV